MVIIVFYNGEKLNTYPNIQRQRLVQTEYGVTIGWKILQLLKILMNCEGYKMLRKC